MPRVVIALFACLFAFPALAADKLVMAPPAAWVKPLEVTAPPIGDSGPAIRILLQDRQLNFSPEGDSEFVDQVVQVRTPQGLAALGSVTLAWNPDTDTITVHRVWIIRAGQTIDVLARQTFTVIRREANLERAMVDGVLTATLQTEGLQVGDLVEIAYTTTHLDPVLQGRSERDTALPFAKADRMRIRASWDAAHPLQWRAGRGLDAPKLTRNGGRVELLVDLRDTDVPKFPSNAPQRYLPLRELSFSQFKSWSEVSSLMAPYFERASTLGSNSPLKAEVARIRAASSDPKVQAAAALSLVEDKVRYLALVLNLGGYIPAEADQTWERRYGDCKAKTALLMALLRELGIEAEAALVHSTRGDGLDTRLPAMSAFDHVIVRAVISGQVYWLDGTRTGDRSLAALRVPPFRWALPLRNAGTSLVSLDPVPLTEPDTLIQLKIDATAGLAVPAPTKGDMTVGPAMGGMMAAGLANLSAADRDKMMRAMWVGLPWIEVKTVTSTQDPDGTTRFTMEGVSRLPFERQPLGQALRIRAAELGADRLPERDADAPSQDAPFMVNGFPGYEAFRLTIALPRGGEGFAFEGPDVNSRIAGRAYTRKSRVGKGVATLEVTKRSLVREVSAAEVKAAREPAAEMAKVRVLLRAPANWRPTDQDLAALAANTPKTADAYIERGSVFLNTARNDQALADFNKAVELDPKSAFAYSNRALGNLYGGKLAQAKADVAKALELDPRNHVALHGVGMIAMREGRHAEAAAAFGRAADLRAGNTFALAAQAGAYVAMDETDKALSVAAELERLAPDRLETRLIRFEIYNASGRRDQALAELDEALAKTPVEARLYIYRGSLLATMGRSDDADKAFARAIEIKPTVEAHMTRAFRRPAADLTGKLRDISAADLLEPGLVLTAARRGETLGEAGRYDEALAGLAMALKAHPADPALMLARADVYLRAGRTALAAKDFAAIRSKHAADADQLNGLCWQQAIRNFALETALADCDAALKLEPNQANATDSRAFVLMRLGRLEESLTTYNAALKLRPRLAESLFGRALTRLRLGQTDLAQADLAAARASDQRVDITFAGYGLSAASGDGKARPAVPG